MRKSYRLSRAARTDLLQIWNYLAEHVSFDVADKVIADLDKGMGAVGKEPSLGHQREDLTDDPVKFYRVHRYLIVYVPGTKPLAIARILHSARDIRSIFGDE